MNKYEFYKRGNVLNLKGVIKKFADVLKSMLPLKDSHGKGFGKGW